MVNRMRLWFWGTWLGSKYLEFLLWLDGKQDYGMYVNKKEVHQIMLQAQQMAYKQGISQLKRQISATLKVRTAEEFNTRMKEIEDLLPLAASKDDKLKDMREALAAVSVRKGKDIKTALDHAKMIEQRINDYADLRAAIVKRNLMRDIRQQKKLGNVGIAAALEQEYRNRYVKGH